MKSFIHLLVPDLRIDLTLLSIVLSVLIALLTRALVRVTALLLLRPRLVDRTRLNPRGTASFPLESAPVGLFVNSTSFYIPI